MKWLLGLPLLAACLDAPTELGAIEQAIIGGQTASPADFPSVAALENGPGMWFCTGTLIRSDWVLTAAHCVTRETPSTLHVRFGDANVGDTTGGVVKDVSAIYKGSFDGTAWGGDIALLELASPVTDRQPTPMSMAPVAFGTRVIDVGFGVSDNREGGGGILRRVDKVTADCAGAGDPGITNSNLLCMNASDGKGSCFGDSGGPTFATIGGQLTVVGVVSGGTGMQCGAGWDIYTSLSGEQTWLDSTFRAAGVDPETTSSTDLVGGCSTSGGAGLLVALGALFSRPRAARADRSRRRRP